MHAAAVQHLNKGATRFELPLQAALRAEGVKVMELISKDPNSFSTGKGRCRAWVSELGGRGVGGARAALGWLSSAAGVSLSACGQASACPVPCYPHLRSSGPEAAGI